MEAKDDLGGRRLFDPQALRTGGHASVAADLEGRAHAPNATPPS